MDGSLHKAMHRTYFPIRYLVLNVMLLFQNWWTEMGWSNRGGQIWQQIFPEPSLLHRWVG